MFFKHLGKKTRTKALDLCEKGVLPVPRSEEENNFFLNIFGQVWLGLSDAKNDGQFWTEDGRKWADAVNEEFSPWSASIQNATENGVILSKSGKWETEDEDEKIDSVCVFNIP